MSLPRFFLENQVLAAEDDPVFPLRLSAEDARHARVLRLKAGEHIAVIDGEADYFECEIVDFADEIPTVRIAARREAENAGPQVLVVQGLAKGDKVDEVIRRGTELGVAGFLPMACRRSVVKLDGRKAAAKTKRWRSVAKSAAMQSGQDRIAQVCEPMTLEEACAQLSGATAVLVCWEEASAACSIGRAIHDALDGLLLPPEDARIAVVIGPEGGLEEGEVERLLACNPRSCLVSLGSSILRTETAGVVAAALALYELGELGGSDRGGRKL